MAHALRKAAFDVIVVEDDETYLQFWKRFLEALGVTSFALVKNPYKAKEMLCKGGCRLLISDINLPDINGYDLAKIVTEHRADCSVILTTAYTAHLSRFDLGNCPFHLLYKPFSNLDELAKLVKHLLGWDVSMDDISEDSFSENDEFPMVTEWKL